MQAEINNILLRLDRQRRVPGWDFEGVWANCHGSHQRAIHTEAINAPDFDLWGLHYT